VKDVSKELMLPGEEARRNKEEGSHAEEKARYIAEGQVE